MKAFISQYRLAVIQGWIIGMDYLSKWNLQLQLFDEPCHKNILCSTVYLSGHVKPCTIHILPKLYYYTALQRQKTYKGKRMKLRKMTFENLPLACVSSFTANTTSLWPHHKTDVYFSQNHINSFLPKIEVFSLCMPVYYSIHIPYIFYSDYHMMWYEAMQHSVPEKRGDRYSA